MKCKDVEYSVSTTFQYWYVLSDETNHIYLWCKAYIQLQVGFFLKSLNIQLCWNWCEQPVKNLSFYWNDNVLHIIPLTITVESYKHDQWIKFTGFFCKTFCNVLFTVLCVLHMNYRFFELHWQEIAPTHSLFRGKITRRCYKINKSN